MKKTDMMKFNILRLWRNITIFAKWTAIAVCTGLVVGGFSTLFAWCLQQVTAIRTQRPWLIFLLPAAGLFIVFMYSIFQYKNDKGTNLVLSTIHARAELPVKMAPLIFIATLVTHLFGGSAGREGAALQLGGSIGNQLGRWMRLDEKDQHIVVMCGMSAAFSAVFGTPIAAAVFAMEVVSVGVMYYAALVPCVFASLIASQFASNMGIAPEVFVIRGLPAFQILPTVKVVLLALCCAGVSVLFCVILHSTGDFYRKHLKNPYLRIVVSALIIIALTCILRTDAYMGAGVGLIEQSIAGNAPASAFLWKIIFTALTLEAGFKGGEIVPSFCVGATFGCLFGSLLHISPALCAAVGMVSVFCGVTNCPITSLLIAFELFGYKAVPFFMIGVSVSYLMSGYYGLYHDQTIVYSKYKTKYINRKTHD